MSPKTHKSEYRILLALAVLTAAVISWLAWQGMVHETGSDDVRTTLSAKEHGLLACYMLLERLDVPVERSHTMLRPDRLAEAGVVFLIDPVIAMTTYETTDLRAWVTQGGVLITTETPSDLGLHGSSDPGQDRSGWYQSPSATTKVDRQPLARDVLKTHFQTDDVFEMTPRVPDKPGDVLTPLYTDDHGIRIGEHPLGRGRIIFLSDCSFLANDHIGRADDAVLAANLVSYARAVSGTGSVLFDEYHFGHRGFNEGLGVLAGLLFTTSAGWAVLTLTVAGLGLLYYMGRQFGPRRGLGKQRRRSKLEHVYAVGATYRFAGAHHLALRLIYGWFRQRVTEQTGLPAGAPSRLIAGELARRPGVHAAECRRAIDTCDALVSQTKVTQRQFTAALEQLARIEKETLNGSGDGKRSGR